MKLYKPFERLFCSIETFFRLIDVGGNNLQVSAAISACQFLNIMTIFSLFTESEDIIYIIYIWIITTVFFVFNGIYFKESKVIQIMNEYKSLERKKRKIAGLLAITYIILSFVFLGISLNF